GLVPVAPDEVEGLVGDQVVDVTRYLDTLTPAQEVSRKFLESGVRLGEAEELVETLVERVDRTRPSAPRAATLPFAEDPRRVTERLERLGDGHFLGRQVLVVAADARVDGRLARQKRRAAGPADRCGGVAARQDHPPGREPVQLRRLPLRPAVE